MQHALVVLPTTSPSSRREQAGSISTARTTSTSAVSDPAVPTPVADTVSFYRAGLMVRVGMERDDYWYWEPRSQTDDLLVWLHGVLDQGAHTAFLVGALIATHLFVFVIGLGMLFHPFIALASLATLVPAAFIVAYLWLYNKELTSPEPLRLLALSFLMGIAFAGLPLAVNTVGFGYFVSSSGTVPLLFLVFVTAPLEEMTKLFAVRFGVLDQEAFSHVLDGIVFGAATGLGFAMFENGVYLTQALTDASLTGVAASRAAATPIHVLTTALAGFYLGLAKFNDRYFGPIVMRGLLIVIAAHALYNGVLALATGMQPGDVQRLDPGSTSHVLSVVAGLAVISGLAYLIVTKIKRYESYAREA